MCPGATFTSTGDPHFKSLDGRYFDAMQLGVFTVCGANVPEGLLIQACHEQWFQGSQASVNRAVAFRYKGQVMAVLWNRNTQRFDL